MKNIYTHNRLRSYGIGEQENQLPKGKATFLPRYFNLTDNEIRNLSNDKQTRILDRPQSIDNIEISFSDAWGDLVRENPYTASTSQHSEDYGEISNGKKWSIPVTRLRIHDKNRYIQKDGKLSPKYRSPAGSSTHIFFNGIYTYFVKPLIEQRLSRAAIVAQLMPTFSKIIVTEGEFKAFAACKVGIPCIGITGIHNGVKTIKETLNKGLLNEWSKTVGATLLSELSDFLLQFDVKEIQLLHDNDCFDNIGNLDRAFSFAASPRNLFFAVRKFNQEHNKRVKLNYCFIDLINGKWGVDDLIQQYPSELSTIKRELFAPAHGVKKFIRKIPITSKDDYQSLRVTFIRSAEHRPIFCNDILISTRATKKRKRRLSKLLKKHRVTLENKRLIAPTGSGKNFTTATTQGKKILACPQTALVRNVGKEYAAAKFYGKEKEYDKLPQSDMIVSTYDSLPNIPQTIHLTQTQTAPLPRADRHLFIDESHNFTTATSKGFRLKAMQNVFNLIPEFGTVTLMTGTPVYDGSGKFDHLDRVIVQIPKSPKTFGYLLSDDTLNAAAVLALEAKEKGKFPIIIMDEKSEERRLGTLKSSLNDDSFKALNSDTKDLREFNDLLENGEIPPHIKGLISTTVLKEGNNIYNKADFEFIFIGNFHPADIEQISNRPRKAKSVNITLVKSDSRETSERKFNPDSFGQNLRDDCNKVIRELDTPAESDERALLMEMKSVFYIQRFPIRCENGRYEIDEFNLNNYVFRAETTAINRNDSLMVKALSKYGINYVGTKSYTGERSEGATQRAQKSRAAAKAKKLDNYKGEVERLKGMTNIAEYCSEGLKYGKLPPMRRKVYQRVEKLGQHIEDTPTILKHLTAKDKDGNDKILSDGKFKELIAKITIYRLQTNKIYMDENRKFAILIRAFQNSFNIGEVISSTEIKQKVKDCLSLVGWFDLAPFDEASRNDKALKVARMFFNLDKMNVRTGENVGKFYKICSLTFDNIINNKQRKLGYIDSEKLVKTAVPF